MLLTCTQLCFGAMCVVMRSRWNIARRSLRWLGALCLPFIYLQ